MKTTLLILVSLLAPVAVSQPHHRHVHGIRHEKMAKREESVVWVTDFAYVTETIPVTTTIWVTPGFVAPSPSTSSAPASSSDGAGLFFETATPPAPSPMATSSTTYIAPASSVPTVVPVSEAAPIDTPVAATPVYVAPAAISPVQEPTSAPAPAAVNTALPTTVAAMPVVLPTTTASGASSGECSSGSPCSGDITHYDTGLGACGWTNDGSETVVALSHLLMGTQSNGNPYCGKTITVSYGGKTVIAKVVDKCMGCSKYSIDLSNAAFSALDNLDAGRTQATWYFN